MIPTLLALPIAALPFAGLLGALGWMAATSERPGRPKAS
jgi:phosphotransferase system  glucose/maltose/N-acetylglucosamine-specific IIC component